MNAVERVKTMCKERKIPISKLESDCGFANGYIGQLRKGVFPDDRLKKIADYFNVSVDYLMTGEEPQFTVEIAKTDVALTNMSSKLFRHILSKFSVQYFENKQNVWYKIIIEGNGNLRKPFPSPELEVVFISKDNRIIQLIKGVLNMLEKGKLRKISKELSANRVDYMSAFRQNLFRYVDDKDITLKEISEKADIPFSTLNTFLYGNSRDIKLSTVVRLAHALDVSIDELVGAETINEVSRESIAICRNLPDNELYLVRWYIRYIDSLNKKNEPHKRYVSVMELECNANGNLKMTSNYRHIDITDIGEEYRSKIFFGITMPCENYMPTYSPYDILLIANDREPYYNENSLLRIDGQLRIAKRKIENGIAKYYSIRDGKYRIDEKDVDEVIGYVACALINPYK